MTDDINNETGFGSTDDQEPVSGGFLSQDEIDQRVAAFRASMLKLDQDSAEATRIDMLIAGANAMFGDDLTPFEDPPAAGPDRDGPQPEGRAAINSSDALPAIEVDCSGPGFSLVINGDHAEPHIHVSGDQADREIRRLREEVAKLREAIPPRETRAEKRPVRKAPRTRAPGPSALIAVLGLASAAIVVYSAAVVQVIAVLILVAVPVLCLAAVVAAAIFSARPERRDAAVSVLRLLMNKDLVRKVPRGEKGGKNNQMVLSGRDVEGADL